jgi:hypothetical protein
MIAHDVLTYLCAGNLGVGEEEISITPYNYEGINDLPLCPDYTFESREGSRPVVESADPRYDESEYYSEFLKYRKPVNGKIPLIQVLSLYSAEPDWGMDCGLKISPLQALMGGSQGYRHLRYGLFFFRAGIVHRMALHYFSLAQTAFGRGDIYWGTRFSAFAVHYIEDLLTPVHTKPFTEIFFFNKMFRARELYFITYNCHLNFERYVAYHLWRGHRRYTDIIKAARPLEIKDLRRSLLQALKKARKLFPVIFEECMSLWGDTMKNGFVKISREEIKRIRPSERFQESVLSWLKFSASFVKGYMKRFVIPYLGTKK